MTKFSDADFNAYVTASADARADLEKRDIAKEYAANDKRFADRCRAFFMTKLFAETVAFCDADFNDVFNLGVKERDRLRDTIGRLFVHDTLATVNDSDQYRYTVNLLRSLVAAYGQKATLLARADQLATATKVEVTNEFVTVSKRVMCDSTAVRQSAIAAKTMQALGLCEVVIQNGKIVGIAVKPKSALFKKVVKMVADGK